MVEIVYEFIYDDEHSLFFKAEEADHAMDAFVGALGVQERYTEYDMVLKGFKHIYGTFTAKDKVTGAIFECKVRRWF
jgi:hypothetical protein